MKAPASLLSIVLAASVSFAGLEDQMKEISQTFKDLGIQVRNPALNADSAVKAARLSVPFKEAANEAPSMIAALPAADQAAALVKYKGWLAEESDLALKLELAFKKNDLQLAMGLLKQMSDVRRLGHDALKPE